MANVTAGETEITIPRTLLVQVGHCPLNWQRKLKRPLSALRPIEGLILFCGKVSLRDNVFTGSFPGSASRLVVVLIRGCFEREQAKLSMS